MHYPDPVSVATQSQELIPEWSGRVIRAGSFGAMLIHIGDTRMHPFPAGWRRTGEQPLYFSNMEVWPLVQEKA